MGLYLNPIGETKEAFLQREGTRVGEDPPEHVEPGFVPVCWVHNGGFTAALIADSEREVKRAVAGMTGRPHIWFIVPKDKINEANGFVGVR